MKKAYSKDAIMKQYEKEIKEYFKENPDEIFPVSKSDRYYVFYPNFDYISHPSEKLDGLHACLVTTDDNRVYYCCTDGIDDTLPFEEYLLVTINPFTAEEVLIIPVEVFEDYFEELDEFDIPSFIENADIIIDFDIEKVTLTNDEYEAEFYLSDGENLGLIPANEFAEFLRREKFLCEVSKKVQEYVLKNFDIDYSRYEYATRNFVIGKLVYDNKEYIVCLDGSGNCFWGGFGMMKAD